MKLFLDSSKVDEIKRWEPVIEGLTTNPSILFKDGGNIDDLFRVFPGKPISVEATGDFETDARKYSGKYPNAVVKIPLLRPEGGDNLSLISRLSSEGIKINCTALFSLGQVILATKAGSRYVSLFGGRIDDEGGEWTAVAEDCMQFLNDEYNREVELIVGSIRTVGMVKDCLRCGVNIVTIPPDVLKKMIESKFSRFTVCQFEEDAKKLK